ncbi:MAG: hypothetical protein HYU03_03840 [Thaumarchaeota archaeon]|nr:hypothetical protein [Nitrososphaerota archaeon]
MSDIAEKAFESVSENVEKEYSSTKAEVEEKVKRAKEKALSQLKRRSSGLGYMLAKQPALFLAELPFTSAFRPSQESIGKNRPRQ